MRAGKNTPQSVLRYIDAIWAKHAPPDPLELARELGYDPKRIRKLKEKHGEDLLAYLEKAMKEKLKVDEDRFMANQQGQVHPEQYVSSPQGAIDDLPVVDELSQARIDAEAKRKKAKRLEEDTKELRAAMAFLKTTIDALPRDKRRAMGRSLWVLRSRLDATEQDLKRRAA